MTNHISARYGAIELRSLYPTFALRGLILAATIHLAIIGAYYLATSLKEDDPPGIIIHISPYNLEQPPSIKETLSPPAVTIASPSAHPENAIPVAVPDATVSPDATIATQDAIDQSPTSADPRIGEGTTVVVDAQPNVDVESEPAPFTPVEKPPVPVINPAPQYPEIPLRAGIEGTVWLKIWVTKEGKTKKAEVVKTDSELFNQAAMDAAMKWVFTPAVMNNGPVAVWVTIPFKFKLQNR
jgi:periplasmic protein TonB